MPTPSNRRLALLVAAGIALLTFSIGLPSIAHAAPSVGFASAVPAQISIGQATRVHFSAEISDPSLIAGSVNLLRLGLPNTNPTIVGRLHDDGVNGDAIAGDGRYSIEVTLNEPAATQAVYRISAAFKGRLQRVQSNNIVVNVAVTAPVGVRLGGPPSSLALDAISNLPPTGADARDIENGVIMTRLELRLAPDATVGEVNAALQSLGARIVTMHPRSLGMTVSIPKQRSVADLAGLAQVLGAMPGIRHAWVAKIPHPSVLPFPATSGNIAASQHLLPTRFPAAWNAKKLLDGCLKVPVLIADHFAPSAPGGFAREIPGFPPASGAAQDPTHGYDVTGTLAALFNESPPTGANPFIECLDLRPIQVGDVSSAQAIQRIAGAFPAGNFILNLSLGIDEAICSATIPPNLLPSPAPCAPDNVLAELTGALTRANLALQWKELTHTRWLDFLAVSAAGNFKDQEGARIYPGLRAAAFSLWPQIARLADPFFSFVLEGSLWDPAPPASADFPSLAASSQQALLLAQDIAIRGLNLIGPADNVLVAGSTIALQTSPLPPSRLHLFLTESVFSNSGPDVTAVGEKVLVVCPEGLCTVTQGTSFAAPQVAGLASYLWLLSPELRSLPAAVTAEAIKANIFNPTVRLIDAYATILSLDAAALPDSRNAPIRKALLDVNEDRKFDQLDLAAFLARFIDPQSGQQVQPTARDFSRHDLNGDGFTGGLSVQRFDLDREGSTQFGATRYTQVLQNIGGSVAFDENSLTDFQILCYYAYSGLYTGTEQAREQLLDGKCAPVTVTVTPAAVTLNSGATRQFGAAVRGAQNVNVTWTATGATNRISPTGLFTAGATAGHFQVRAISVADPRAFADAIVTVIASEETYAGTVTVTFEGADTRCQPPFGCFTDTMSRTETYDLQVVGVPSASFILSGTVRMTMRVTSRIPLPRLDDDPIDFCDRTFVYDLSGTDLRLGGQRLGPGLFSGPLIGSQLSAEYAGGGTVFTCSSPEGVPNGIRGRSTVNVLPRAELVDGELQAIVWDGVITLLDPMRGTESLAESVVRGATRRVIGTQRATGRLERVR